MRNFKLLTQLLLSKGANVDQKDNFGATPLMYASQGGVCQMMEILIRDGNADLERKDKYNNTALHYAIAYNQIAAANFLESVKIKEGQNHKYSLLILWYLLEL